MISLILLAVSFFLYRKGNAANEVYAAILESLGARMGVLSFISAIIICLSWVVCHAVATGSTAVLDWCTNLTANYSAECLAAVHSSVVWQDLVESLEYALIVVVVL